MDVSIDLGDSYNFLSDYFNIRVEKDYFNKVRFNLPRRFKILETKEEIDDYIKSIDDRTNTLDDVDFKKEELLNYFLERIMTVVTRIGKPSIYNIVSKYKLKTIPKQLREYISPVKFSFLRDPDNINVEDLFKEEDDKDNDAMLIGSHAMVMNNANFIETCKYYLSEGNPRSKYFDPESIFHITELDTLDKYKYNTNENNPFYSLWKRKTGEDRYWYYGILDADFQKKLNYSFPFQSIGFFSRSNNSYIMNIPESILYNRVVDVNEYLNFLNFGAAIKLSTINNNENPGNKLLVRFYYKDIVGTTTDNVIVSKFEIIKPIIWNPYKASLF